MVGNRDDGYLAECMRPVCHTGPHAFVTPEGQAYVWEDDFTCDCCTPEEDSRCYSYWLLSVKETIRLIHQRD